MTDTQILLTFIGTLITVITGIVGFRALRNGKAEDVIYEGLTQDAKRLGQLVARLRTQLDEEIATRHANEQKLRRDLAEAEALIARFKVEVDLLRSQVKGLGAEPVA
ncbi:hypothetical protein [Coralloluteibacterium thermophilus]|uniref:Uncharacterized protein n=1 Tax=Coralloluteibacterium thermophilum TaxID=2707049 RepID=A0ABV9NIQ1_9GAMM